LIIFFSVQRKGEIPNDYFDIVKIE